MLRFNAPPGEVPYNGTAISTAQEVGSVAPRILSTLTDTDAYLVEGENVLAVHAFNQSLGQSTDFGFNAQLSAIVVDPSAIPPRVAAVTPAPGSRT